MIREVVTQGGILSIVLYGLSLYVLSEKIRGDYPRLLQLLYDNDFSNACDSNQLKPTIVWYYMWLLYLTMEFTVFAILGGLREDINVSHIPTIVQTRWVGPADRGGGVGSNDYKQGWFY